MNKDLSKEYKEAVMNDLPDLWGRIEAAIDAEESAKTNGNETPGSNVINFSKPENNTVSSVNKYAVNAYDNEPVMGRVEKKKKFRIPAWVFVAIPSAAILLLVIIPVGFLMTRGGMGEKSATNMAEPATITTCAESATDSVVYDVASEAASSDFEEEAEERQYSDSAVNENAQLTYDFATGNEKNESKEGIINEYTLSSETINGDNFSNLTTPDAAGEFNGIINDNVSVKFLSVYENDEGLRLADVEIIEVLGDYDLIPADFKEFEEGEILTAYIPADFEDSDLNGKEYNCIVKYVADDEIIYAIEPKKADR